MPAWPTTGAGHVVVGTLATTTTNPAGDAEPRKAGPTSRCLGVYRLPDSAESPFRRRLDSPRRGALEFSGASDKPRREPQALRAIRAYWVKRLGRFRFGLVRFPVTDFTEVWIAKFFLAVGTSRRILGIPAAVRAVVLASKPHFAEAAMHA